MPSLKLISSDPPVEKKNLEMHAVFIISISAMLTSITLVVLYAIGFISHDSSSTCHPTMMPTKLYNEGIHSIASSIASPTCYATTPSPTINTTVLVLYAYSTSSPAPTIASANCSSPDASQYSTYTSFSCTSAQVLASLSPTQPLSGIAATLGAPSSTPVVGPLGTMISSSWSNFLNNTISQTFVAAGVTNSPSSLFWDGSDANGGVAYSTCFSWTTSSSLQFGAEGSLTATTNYLQSGSYGLCNAMGSRNVVCVCLGSH